MWRFKKTTYNEMSGSCYLPPTVNVHEAMCDIVLHATLLLSKNTEHLPAAVVT